MVQDNYNAFVGGDGSCAGCGEKSVLRGVVTMTEALMRPLWDKKVARELALSEKIKTNGVAALNALKSKSNDSYEALKLTIQHLILGLGSDSKEETLKRIKEEYKGTDENLISALAMVLETDANNHRKLVSLEGKHLGMSVMGMTASTGCNTVYGSTHPSNPHSYPWMNSLFQDGATIGWLVAESFIMDHAKRSVIPERISKIILEADTSFDMDSYESLLHLTDTHMTDLEILELPKVWAIGGDGALGDIGFQNLSKAVLQNRPNFHVLMLDTQVYSNTGGQNSDSSIMPGGFDMNQYGKYTEGKLTERKELAQIFTSGHGSPYIASVSMASTAKFYKAVLDGLTYRGMTFIQSYTTCQPEHGVGDDQSQELALQVRDSRGAPEFTFNPALGELCSEAFNIKGNPRSSRDWQVKKDADKKEYIYSVAQWAANEGRFRKHFYKIKPEEEVASLDEVLLRINQNDVTYRRFLNKDHRAFVPLKGVYTDIVDGNGKRKRMGVSRQLVLFSVERRKNWRILQSKAGIVNKDYLAQKEMLKRFDAEELSKEDFLKDTTAIYQSVIEELK